jgi:hypothetical protein
MYNLPDIAESAKDLYHTAQTVHTEDTEVLTPVELIEVIES